MRLLFVDTAGCREAQTTDHHLLPAGFGIKLRWEEIAARNNRGDVRGSYLTQSDDKWRTFTDSR